MVASWSCTAFKAASVSARRLPSSWLWLRSTTTETTLFSGSRSSLMMTGLKRASASAAAARRRISPPRIRNAIVASTSNASGTRMAISHGVERNGSNSIFIPASLIPQPLDEVLGVDLVGLVVAGQHIHHDVHAAANGIDALHR